MFFSGNLAVMNINMYEKINRLSHHTDAYKLSKLIIRRGQEFIMGIVFNRQFDPKTDLFFIEFLIGEPLLSVYIKYETVPLLFSNEKDKGVSIIIECIWITLYYKVCKSQ